MARVGLASVPLPAVAPSQGATAFERMSPAATGVDFVYRSNTSPKYEKLLNSSVVGGGVAVGDFDDDGWPDLCLTRPAGGCQLYRNLGGFRFTNVTAQAGIHDPDAWTTGATFADVDGDGRLDLYVCVYDGPNRLHLNQGNGTFQERAKAFGLDFNGASVMAAFGDYDRDGRLDCYLLTGGLIPNASQRFRVKFVDGRPVVPEELREFWQLIYQPGERAAAAEAGQLDHLFHNTGSGSFTEVSQAAGLRGFDFGNAVLWWDYNDDGWPDLYVANDYFGPDRLYRNNGDGTFTDVAPAALPYTPWTSMGADIADLNNDGRLDLMASDMAGTTHLKRMVDLGDMERSGWFLDLAEPRQYMRNAVYLNTGTGRFLEAAHLLGLAATDWTWSLVFGDLDNDGREDLFVPNGMTRDWMDNDLAMQAQALPPADFGRFWKAQPVRRDQNLAFRNLGDLRFKDASRSWGLDQLGPSFGAALADLDRDGRLDLVVNDYEAPARICRNDTQPAHRLTVRLRGRTNHWGVGATIRIESAEGRQMRYLTPAHGFMSATEPVAHFGLGACDVARRLTVQWPSGHWQAFTNLAADRAYTISESEPPGTQPASPPPPATLFARSDLIPGLKHEAAGVDEFARQPLLPVALGLTGPGQAWGDVDGDGLEDFYVGGSARKPGVLLRHRAGGKFEADPGAGLGTGVEEAAPLFFDANGDGFVDLYVATGGNHLEPGAAALRDALFLNDGQGHFTAAPEGCLPDLRDSGSVVVAADFDRDGDLDLFVGSRVVPGRFPLTPESRLLRNEGGRFTEVTDEAAPGLRRAGMVTSALGSDVDGDGWVDLLVTCEWGPVRLFQNHGGHFSEKTREAGLAERLGWWNGLTAGDVDNDGDIDYGVTNWGLNSRYQPTPGAPCLLYSGDFAGTGDPQLIEAASGPDGIWPLRGRSALVRALPALAAQFGSHRAYAVAQLPELLGPESLRRATRFTLNTLESGILLNNGAGQFAFRPLPRVAQIAPAFGAVLQDVDGDGLCDLYLAQNSSAPQRETGNMTAGLSLLCRGEPGAGFQPLWPAESGLVVAGDGRSLTCADLNADGRPDFVVGLNAGPLVAFANEYGGPNRFFAVRLLGLKGNPTGVGARVSVQLDDGTRRTAEVHAGGGWLSQGSAVLRFGLGPRAGVEAVEIRWPDGRSTRHKGSWPGGFAAIRQE